VIAQSHPECHIKNGNLAAPWKFRHLFRGFNMPKTVNVALIGFGRAGRTYHAPLIAHIEGLRLATVVSSRPDEVHRVYPGVTVQSSPEAAFADPEIDLIVIATPNDTHYRLAAAALAHGKHVVTDKPFTATSGEARELIGQAERTGKLISVYHNRRWDADFLTLQRIITEGKLGPIAYFESRFDRFRTPNGNWREQAGKANGLWFDVGPHLADQALMLFGRPRAVSADFAIFRKDVTAPDYFTVLLRYDDKRIVLTVNFMAAANDLRFLMHGCNGSFVKCGADPQEAALAAGKYPAADWGYDLRDGEMILADGTKCLVPSEAGNYPHYYIGVRDAICEGKPLPVSAAEALTVIELIECAERSAAEHREILFT
jgi:predicted dehydrogenase